MNVFIERNQPVSLASVMHFIDPDPMLLKSIKKGYNKGLFELSLQGWNHDDYSNLSGVQRQDSLSKANKKMEELFGIPSNIFTPLTPHLMTPSLLHEYLHRHILSKKNRCAFCKFTNEVSSDPLNQEIVT
jgi:hypothetical protein